jgi:putative polyhydroxyalkanoate system protein
VSDIVIQRHHHLGLAKAKAVADKVAADLGQRYDLQSEWSGHTLHFHRSGLEGHLHVSKDQLSCSVKLGFLMRAFKGPIQAAMEEQLDALLTAPAHEPAAAGKKDAAEPVAARKSAKPAAKSPAKSAAAAKKPAR